MSYLQARSGIARSGVTRCGLYPRLLFSKIGGVSRQIGDVSVTENLDIQQPNAATFTARAYDVSALQEITIGLGHAQNYLFAGHVQEVNARILGFESSTGLIYQCAADDYSWLMNSHDVVFAVYHDRGVNSIVGDILYRFTEGGFAPGEIPSSLGNLTISFFGDSVTSALAAIGKACGAPPRIDYQKRVHLVPAVTDGNPLSIIDSTLGISEMDWAAVAPQVRTRVKFAGTGGSTVAVTPAGATTILVDETGHYASGGGQVLANHLVITYTGVSIASGEGQLTGCSGVLDDIPSGSQVKVFLTIDDAGAQGVIAGILGGGSSGIVTHFISNGNLGAASALGRAQTDLDLAKNVRTPLEFTAFNNQDAYQVGKRVTANLTTPKVINDDFTIQSIVITGQTDGAPETDGSMVFQRRVKAVQYVKSLISLLGGLE